MSPGDNDKKHCQRIRITGRVQGVCFRYYTKVKADRLGVTGWVKNCLDNGVESLICGNDEQLLAMKQWLAHGPEMAQVDAIQSEQAKPENMPDSFKIIYERFF